MSSFAEELALAREQLAIEEAEIDDEVATTRAARDRLAPLVEPELAASYERLRAKLGGIGVALAREWRLRRLPPAVAGG